MGDEGKKENAEAGCNARRHGIDEEVVIRDLQHAELNGLHRWIAGWDAVRERYRVQLEGGRVIAVREVHVQRRKNK